MEGYTEITGQEEMDQLVDSMAGFHDSMTKEIQIMNRGYVLPNLGMMMSHRFDARVLIQSGWEPNTGVELVFVGVAEMSIHDAGEYWDGYGKVEEIRRPVERREIKMKFDSSLMIKSERVLFRYRPDWLGPQSFLHGLCRHPRPCRQHPSRVCGGSVRSAVMPGSIELMKFMLIVHHAAA